MKLENIEIKKVVFKKKGRKALMVFVAEDGRQFALMSYDESVGKNRPVDVVEVTDKIFNETS